LVWSFFIVLFDGYDISAISFAAPELIRTWGISNRAALGPVFSASLFGILIGSPLFGYAGDRFGRKAAVIASCLVGGVFAELFLDPRLRRLDDVGVGLRPRPSAPFAALLGEDERLEQPVVR